MNNLLVLLLMTAGTVGATLGVARTDPSVEGWETRFQADVPLTTTSLALLAFGVVLRQAGNRAAAQTLHKQRLGTAGLANSLDRMAVELDGIVAAVALEPGAGSAISVPISQLLDGPLKESLSSSVAGCMALRASHGSAEYANVMGPLAKVERMLNRAWSAAADGYSEEAQRCLQQARTALEETRAALGEIT